MQGVLEVCRGRGRVTGQLCVVDVCCGRVTGLLCVVDVCCVQGIVEVCCVQGVVDVCCGCVTGL